jgi:DNA-binding IclR family transcriptional regulator
VAVLEAVAKFGGEHPDGIGPTRVAEQVGCDKSQASRTLGVLHSLGLLERTRENGGYRISWALYGLAMRGLDQRLVRIASPVLRGLSRDLGQRVYLVVLQGVDVMPVWSEAGPGAITDMWPVGRVWPAYASASGRALLFDWGHEGLREQFGIQPFPRFTSQTPRDVDELWLRLRREVGVGFSSGLGEFSRDTVTLGVPVYGPDRRVVAAIAVAGRRDFTAKMEEAGHKALETARYIRGHL